MLNACGQLARKRWIRRGRRPGTRRSEGAEEQIEGLVPFVTTGPSSWFFLVCYVASSGADSREYHVSQRQHTKVE